MFTKQTLLLSALTVAAVAATATPASAADTVVVPMGSGEAVAQMTALDGTLVWSTGDALFKRDPDGTIDPVEGAPAASYRSIDLGLNASGNIVLTYLRCGGPRDGCAAFSDDLAGSRARFKHLAPKRCAVSAAPARWGARVAYGLRCGRLRGPLNVFDAARSGLFVRKGSGPAKRLRVPSGNAEFDVHVVTTVDLRGTDVAAVVNSAGYSRAVVQTIEARRRRATELSGGSSESQYSEAGVALGSGGALWSLLEGRSDDVTSAALQRTDDTGCTRVESLPSVPGQSYPAEAMASDGTQTFLFVRGTGIVTHAWHPEPECS